LAALLILAEKKWFVGLVGSWIVEVNQEGRKEGIGFVFPDYLYFKLKLINFNVAPCFTLKPNPPAAQTTRSSSSAQGIIVIMVYVSA
jgi:hypothetical protein